MEHPLVPKKPLHRCRSRLTWGLLQIPGGGCAIEIVVDVAVELARTWCGAADGKQGELQLEDVW